MTEPLAEQLRRLPSAAAVGWFLCAWHGIPALPPPAQPSPIPSLLGQLLALGRIHPAICSRQNRLIDPVEVDDGLLGTVALSNHPIRLPPLRPSTHQLIATIE